MRYLLGLFLILTTTVVDANPYNFPILRVIDGDTVEIQANFLPKELKQVLKVRVLGIDTPEKAPRAQCAKEAELGKKATEFTKQIVANAKHIEIILNGWDKYGGRVLGDLIIDGRPLSQLLLSNGLAREYHGEAKQSWCN